MCIFVKRHKIPDSIDPCPLRTSKGLTIMPATVKIQTRGVRNKMQVALRQEQIDECAPFSACIRKNRSTVASFSAWRPSQLLRSNALFPSHGKISSRVHVSTVPVRRQGQAYLSSRAKIMPLYAELRRAINAPPAPLHRKMYYGF